MTHISNDEAAWIALATIFPMLFYLRFSAYQMRQRMTLHKAVIDKFSTAESFAAFLQSPAGEKFITSLSGSESPARAVIGAIQKGTVLAFLGAGVWWIGLTMESKAEVAGIGILLLCAGAGILLSAGISYRLSQAWGLMDKPAREN
jgi:hypothetical protein